MFCLGYSFYDEHVNDIIYQALSIPSFTLVIANYKSNTEIEKLKSLNDKRIIILDCEDEKQSTFTGFVQNIMPDLYEEEEQEIILNTMKKLYSGDEKGGAEDVTE